MSFSAVGQAYTSDVSMEYAVVGNDAFFKCKLPSFVAEFVSVLSWSDSESNAVYPSLNPGMNTRDCVLKRTCCIQRHTTKKSQVCVF